MSKIKRYLILISVLICLSVNCFAGIYSNPNSEYYNPTLIKYGRPIAYGLAGCLILGGISGIYSSPTMSGSLCNEMVAFMGVYFCVAIYEW